MLGRYRRRRLGPAFAWLGVAFYSSEIPAPADGHVIAACASSVEQAAGGMGFADVGCGENNRAREAFVPARRVALDHKERRDIVRGNRRFGRHRPLKREVRRGGFGKFISHASPTRTQTRA